MKFSNTLIKKRFNTSRFILPISIFLGGTIRILTAYSAGFPIGDGGLFYLMVVRLQENNFQLPNLVQYSGFDLPFVYPPLGFYLAGLTSTLLHTPLIKIFQFLPATILIIQIIAFNELATSLLNSRKKASVATFMFAFLPRTITWMIMGGGITRSIGQLFLIVAIHHIYLVFKSPSKKHLALATFSSSLVCLSHPEATLHTIIISLILFLTVSRKRRGLIDASMIGVGVLLLTSPWWFTIIKQFGVTPFLTASQTGLYTPFAPLAVLFTTYTAEPFTTMIAALAIIGIATSITQKNFFLPLFYIVPFLIEPRNAPNVAVIPSALLASVALTDVIFPALKNIAKQIETKNTIKTSYRLGIIFLAFQISLTLVMGFFLYSARISQNTVSSENRQAFQWVKENTPTNSNFLVLTGNTNVFRDATSEWFPALAERTNLLTVQSGEWITETPFFERLNNAINTQSCVRNVSAQLACLEENLSLLKNKSYDYIYIAQQTYIWENEDGMNMNVIIGDALINELEEMQTKYQEVYRNTNVIIFKKQK